MAKISVVMCCLNGADTVEAACLSAAWADELVVVDAGSTDGTLAIVRRYADRVLEEPWRGFTGQRKFGADAASHDWVFFLDADEEVSPRLAEQVRGLSDAELDGLDLVWVRRNNWVLGRPVRAWRPDWLDRLCHRGRVTWADEALHDKRRPSDPSRQKRLDGWLEHKRLSRAGFADYFSGARLDARLLPVARQMHARGKRVSPLGLWLRPHLAFFKFYVLKLGLLDGTLGLLIAQKAAVSTQLKYAALWAVQHGEAGEPAASAALPPADGNARPQNADATPPAVLTPATPPAPAPASNP